MASEAQSTQGTTIGYGDADTGPFTDVGEITNYGAPGSEAAEIDVTNLSSTQMETIAGLAQAPEFTFDMNFAPGNAAHQAVYALGQSHEKKFWQVNLHDSATPTKVTFEGYISKFPGFGGGVNEAVKISGITVKVTSTPVVTWPA